MKGNCCGIDTYNGRGIFMVEMKCPVTFDAVKGRKIDIACTKGGENTSYRSLVKNQVDFLCSGQERLQ